MAPRPQLGDLIIRNTVNQQVDVVDANGHHVAGPFDSFVAAHHYAHAETKGGAVWHQAVDFRGRPLGDPAPVPVTPDRLKP